MSTNSRPSTHATRANPTSTINGLDMEHEVQERRQKRINRMLRDSSLPLEKTLDTFQRNRPTTRG